MWAAFGNVVQGFAAQYPAGAEKLPRVHVIEIDAVGVYPMLHAGEHTEPDAVDGWQLLNVSLALSGGGAHALGLHVPVGDEKFPAEQVMLRDPLVVYPLAHEREQDVLPGVREALHVPA